VLTKEEGTSGGDEGGGGVFGLTVETTVLVSVPLIKYAQERHSRDERSHDGKYDNLHICGV
jgi:hypothetical protein